MKIKSQEAKEKSNGCIAVGQPGKGHRMVILNSKKQSAQGGRPAKSHDFSGHPQDNPHRSTGPQKAVQVVEEKYIFPQLPIYPMGQCGDGSKERGCGFRSHPPGKHPMLNDKGIGRLKKEKEIHHCCG